MSTGVPNEKIFKYYSVFPPELRMIVIEEMYPRDRCRFTRCSKLSNKEAKSSKNYIYSLKMKSRGINTIDIDIVHNRLNQYLDFRYEFENHGQKSMKYTSFSVWGPIQLWAEVLEDSTDLALYAAEHFKKLLRVYQTKIKRLSMVGVCTSLKDYDFGIENLKNLEELEVDFSINVPHLLSKIHHPLKVFRMDDSWWANIRGSALADHEKIYQVQDLLQISCIQLNYEQMIRLSASKIYLNIGDFTEKDIFNFIRSWQNGTIGQRLASCEWKGKPKFEIEQLFRLLGMHIQQNAKWKRLSLQIKQNKQHGKSASLYFSKKNGCLEFRLDEEVITL